MSPRSSQEEPPAPPGSTEDPDAPVPWQQRFYQNIWVWAGAALLFWLVSYVIWGSVELLILPEG